jgi:serine protease inhibitor ecotin
MFNQYIYEISDTFINLNGSKYVYLAIDEFSKSNPVSFVTPLPTSFINKSIIARITLDKSSYGFNSVLPANVYNGLLVSDVRTYSGKIDIQKLNIQLLNDFGNPISLNGMDFSLCLEVEYE